MKIQLPLRNFKFFQNTLLIISILLFSTTNAFSQCAYPSGATKVGIDYTFCIDNTTSFTTGQVNAGQYVVVNIVQGFKYTFAVGSEFFGLYETLNLYNAANNVHLAYNSGLSGASITWTSTFSGQVKLLFSKGNCLNDNTPGGPLTLAINSVGNTLDSQTTFGTNQWIGHVYNWSGSNPPGGSSPASPSVANPFITANYVGYYNIGSEEITETFGGSTTCFPLLSANSNKVNIYTETFAVRYRMRSTKTGYYMMKVSADDGVRVYVDGNLVLNQWIDQGLTEYCKTLIYLNGNSDIVLDYYENTGGNAVNFILEDLVTTSNNIAGLSERTVCAGNSAGLLDASTYAHCAGAVNTGVQFQWQASTNNVTFSDIVGATAEDYTPPALSTNRIDYYRRLVKSKGLNSAIGGVPSNLITVNTNASIGGTVSAPQTICSGTAPASLTLTGHTGSVVRWEKASNINFTGGTPIASTATTLSGASIGNLTANTYFRAVVQNGICPLAYSVPVLITLGGAVANNTLSYTNGNSGQISATPSENGNAVLISPTGTYFSTVNFASYGTPNGTAPNFTLGACHSTTSQTVVEGLLLGNSTATIPATNGVFGDPCDGTPKSLYVLASYVQPICSGTSVTITGSVPTGGNGTYIYQWQSSASPNSGFANAAGTNNGQNYTIGNLTQTTYFRRLVTSCSYTITSAVVMVKVNETPTITTAAAAASVCRSATAQTSSLPYSATTGLPTTYSITWNSTPVNTFAAVSNVALTASSISIAVPANTAAGTYTGNITVKNASGCISVAKTFTLTVNPQNTVVLNSAAGTDNQTLCINTPLTSIIYTTTGATGITNSDVSGANGLPAGVTATWASNIITISGTPTASGTFNYSIPLTGGCGTVNAIGTIKVTANNTVTLTSATGTNNQTRCIGTAITPITYTTTGATGATVSGLPTGVTGTWASNVVTISGTPTASGPFNYTVSLTGGCGSASAAGTLIVNTSPQITITKTDETCPGAKNGTIKPVLSGGLSNIRYIKLTQKYNAAQQVMEIQAYEIFTGTNVALETNGAKATASSVAWGNVSTFGPLKAIDGVMTGQSFWHSDNSTVGEWIKVDLMSGKNIDYLRLYNRDGEFAYRGQNMLLELFDEAEKLVYSQTVDLWGGVNAPGNFVQVNLLDVSWMDAATTLNRAGLGAGTYTLNFADEAGCSTSSPVIIATTNQNATASPASSSPTLCINTALTAITHTTTGATGIGAPIGLPAGVTATWASNVITISGTPTASGTFNYSIPLTGGCGTVNGIGTIKVTPLALTPNAASSLSLSLSGATVTGAFTAASPTPTGYLIVRSLTTTPFVPGNGTSYATGDAVGNYYIVRGTGTPSTATGFTNNLPTNGMYYYSVFSFNNGCGTVPLYSAGTSRNIKYICSPGSTSADRYISNVQFVGTLSPDTTNPTGYSAGGYGNFTNKAEKGKQIPGGAVNVNLSTVAPAGKYNYAKAWVDWNKDGIYEATESVYDSGGTGIIDIIFGYVVPPTHTLGFYTLRIKVFDGSTFDACGTMANGETEDYSFEVIADCVAKIQNVTVSQRCGAGPVILTATGTSATVSYLWYKQEFGTPIPGTTSNTFTTEALAVGTYTYYVRAVGSSCTSVYYRPVKVTVSPTPTLQFTQTSPDICGYESSIKVTSSGDKQEVNLLNENFDSFNNFENVVENTAAGAAESNWQLRPSPYVFTNIITPAVSSGYDGGNYAAIVTDKQRTSNLLNHLTLKNSLNSTGYLNLNLDFDLYYFSEFDNDITRGYLKVQYSLNNGGAWSDIPTVGSNKSLFTEDRGIPTKWDKISIVLPAECIGQPQLKFRISMFAYGSSGTGAEYMVNLAAVDNIRLYGDKPLETSFSWEGIGLSVFKANCTDPYNNTPTNEICIKPTPQQIEDYAQFTLTARAALSNGCSAEGTLTITNSSKTWNNPAEVNNWQTATAWKPVGSPGLPSSDKCVIIKSPVELGATTTGFAKNLLIETGGALDIKGNLTVTDFIINKNASADSLIVKSDGNLLQLNESKTINEGSLKAEREVKGIKYNPAAGANQAIDYVYWSSPVAGQQTKGAGGFSPGTPANRFYYYLESNDRFYETGDPTFRPGRGYAVRAEEGKGIVYDKTYEFRGVPHNGEVNFGIIRSPDNPVGVVHGYNLVGNPYPSNIDFDELHYGNSALIYNTAWFWTNSTFTLHQMGSGYTGNNYAVYNGSGGTPATYNPAIPYKGDLKPNGIIKVGQGFLVQKKTVGTENLTFRNSYGPEHNLRVGDSGIFFTKGAAPKNRFWLKLSSPNGLVNTQLIGYFPAATDGYEQDYDAEILSMSSDLFYSKLADKQLLIQGKGNFVVEDKVVLGANFYKNSSYTISLETPEGIFASGQRIYLNDKNTGTLTNLSETPYTFDTTAGTSEGRFEIVYKPEQVLATGGTDKESLVVYKDGNTFVVKAQSKKINTLELYDSSGRLIYSLQPNSTKAVISSETLNEGVYVLKINQNGLQTLRKVLK